MDLGTEQNQKKYICTNGELMIEWIRDCVNWRLENVHENELIYILITVFVWFRCAMASSTFDTCGCFSFYFILFAQFRKLDSMNSLRS